MDCGQILVHQKLTKIECKLVVDLLAYQNNLRIKNLQNVYIVYADKLSRKYFQFR